MHESNFCWHVLICIQPGWLANSIAETAKKCADALCVCWPIGLAGRSHSIELLAVSLACVMQTVSWLTLAFGAVLAHPHAAAPPHCETHSRPLQAACSGCEQVVWKMVQTVLGMGSASLGKARGAARHWTLSVGSVPFQPTAPLRGTHKAAHGLIWTAQLAAPDWSADCTTPQ